ncbi:MAG TPA: geranylgeranyl reductase family protein [Solirubrobacteraceae bacterium]|nr:geranylgeranyl reductase family protein [Solirubrobacteraceae bacterium]
MVTLRLRSAVDHDIAVVGAGPAGAATAAYLARAGLDVVLIDQKRFPRDKVCGDFVGPVALRELRNLGVTGREDYRRSNKIREAALYLDGRRLIVRDIPHVAGLPAYGRVVPRERLDAWILGAARDAGARVLEEHRLEQIEDDGDGLRLRLRLRCAAGADAAVSTLSARAVVGADGSNSQTARILRGANLEKRSRIIAVRAYYEQVAGPPERADLYFSGSSFPGYYWLFPTARGHANVGVGMVLATVPPTREHLRTLLLGLVASDAALRARLAPAALQGRVVGWPLSTYDHRQPIVADRMLLVGDAAGLINPLNGEGIQYALLSARWSAQTLVQAFAHADLSRRALAPYEHEVRTQLRYDMALSQMIVGLIRNRTLNAVWLRMLRILIARAKTDPEFAEIAGGILAGLLPASDAISRRMVLGTLEQAALSLGVDAAVTVVRERRNLPGLGVAPLRLGFQVAYDTLANPTQMLGWAGSLPPAAVELAGQAARDTLRAGAHRSRSIM